VGPFDNKKGENQEKPNNMLMAQQQSVHFVSKCAISIDLNQAKLVFQVYNIINILSVSMFSIILNSVYWLLVITKKKSSINNKRLFI